MSNKQYGEPLILFEDNQKAQRLTQIPYGSPPFREEKLQQLLSENPEIIPINEIEPAFSPLVLLGIEIPTSAGSIDILFSSPSGYLTIVETKLWDNPEARRKVVAQIIDYATELSRWSFDDLSEAVKNSNKQNDEQNEHDILQVMKNFEGDFDQRNYIDAVTRNLQRGNFLLLVVGDGIREGVESISKYLQKTPALHFSLALIELNLYRVNAHEDYPLYIQPRTIARTAEIERAVVNINAPSNMEVDVSLPEDQKETKGKPRKQLTEDLFFNELAKNTDDDTAQKLQSLFERLKSIGLVTRWRASSVSLRLPDPSESGVEFTVTVFTISGTFYLGWLSYINTRGGYDFVIAKKFRNSIVKLFGLAEEGYDATQEASVKNLLEKEDEYLECVQSFIKELHQSAQII